MEMEGWARKAIKNGVHGYADLYMDSRYYHSLKFKSGFEKLSQPSNKYTATMIYGDCEYFYCKFDDILPNLR